MGRRRGFDPEAAVRSAMTLFWQRGYYSVSFDTLVDEIGASRKGLYALWPDKQALLVAALKNYRQMVGDHFLRDLEGADAGLVELAGFWSKFESAARQSGWSGCLVMRTAADKVAAEPHVAAEIKAYFERLSDAFEKALRGALRRREIESDPSPHLRAHQAFAAAVACSAIGSFEGFTPPIANLIAAGRAACGVSPHAPVSRLGRRISKRQGQPIVEGR
jgi:TetR/AcrR family transcriptional repressor of nem operon